EEGTHVSHSRASARRRHTRGKRQGTGGSDQFFNDTVAESSQPSNLSRLEAPNKLAMLTGMAALGWLTPRRRSATARSVLAGEASAEAARKSSQDVPPEEPEFPVLGDDKAAAFFDLD